MYCHVHFVALTCLMNWIELYRCESQLSWEKEQWSSPHTSRSIASHDSPASKSWPWMSANGRRGSSYCPPNISKRSCRIITSYPVPVAPEKLASPGFHPSGWCSTLSFNKDPQREHDSMCDSSLSPTRPCSRTVSVQLPDILSSCTPFELRVNRHCRSVSRASEAWLCDVGLKLEWKGIKVGLWASLCYPGADLSQLRLGADFLSLLVYEQEQDGCTDENEVFDL